MSQYYGNQTSDLSITMTSSSIVSDVEEMSSLAPILFAQTISVEDCAESFDIEDIGKTFANILTTSFNNGNYDAVLELADELLIQHPKSPFLHNIIAEVSAVIDKTHSIFWIGLKVGEK